MNSRTALTQLVELTGNTADAYTTALFVVDPAGGSLTLKAYLSLSPNIKPEVVVKLGKGVVGQVAVDRAPCIKDFSREKPPAFEWYKKKEDIKGLLAVPVIHNQLEGVLVMDSKEQYQFSTKLQKIITGFADQMAWQLNLEKQHPEWIDGEPAAFPQILKWCRHLAQAPDRKTLSKRLINLPPNLLPCDAIAVVWFKSDGAGCVTHSRGWKQSLENLNIEIGKGVCGSCASTGTPVLIRNTGKRKFVLFGSGEKNEPWGSLLAAPFIAGQQVPGVVLCATKAINGLDQEQLDKLSMITAFASFAWARIENQRQLEFDQTLCPVTGFPNQRFLYGNLRSVESKLFQDRQPSAVLMVSLNNLHSIYGTHGLAGGDQFLEKFMTLLEKIISIPKFIIKFSDSALLIHLANLDASEARSLEDELNNSFHHTALDIGTTPVPVQVDFGIALYPSDADQLNDLIGIALSRASQNEERIHV